jgi:membrane associated rhomboid family serine protease
MDRAPAFNLPPVVVWLTLALIGVHLLRMFLSPYAEEWLLLAFAFIPARYGPLGEGLPGGWGADIWSPVTHAFLHANWLHFGVNAIWMASFGSALARRFRAARFLILSAVAAAAGAGFHYLSYAGDAALMIGASGAVSGMMAAATRFAFAPGGPLAGGGARPAAYRIPAEPLAAVLVNPRALAFILVWFGVNLLFGLGGDMLPGVSGPIAWQAHVGGFLAGLLLFPVLDPVDRASPHLASATPSEYTRQPELREDRREE